MHYTCVFFVIVLITLDIYAGDAWKTMLNAVGSIVQETEREVLASLTKFVDQLPSVMNEVCGSC